MLIKYVVTETGEVTDVKALKGPPELFAVCIAVVKSEHYKPARDAQGHPFLVTRFRKFHMRLRT